MRWTCRSSPSSSRAAAMNSRWSADSSTNETTADSPARRARRARPAAGRRAASRPRRRGPGAGSRSARARGRRRGPRRGRAPRAGARDGSPGSPRAHPAGARSGRGRCGSVCTARAYANARWPRCSGSTPHARARSDARLRVRPPRPPIARLLACWLSLAIARRRVSAATVPSDRDLRARPRPARPHGRPEQRRRSSPTDYPGEGRRAVWPGRHPGRRARGLPRQPQADLGDGRPRRSSSSCARRTSRSSTKIADPAFGDQRHGLARPPHRARRRRRPRRSSPTVNGTGPYRARSAGTVAPRSASPGTTGTGATPPPNERVIVRWDPAIGAAGERAPGGHRRRHRRARRAGRRGDRRRRRASSVPPRAGLDAVYLGISNTVRSVRQRGASGAPWRSASTGELDRVVLAARRRRSPRTTLRAPSRTRAPAGLVRVRPDPGQGDARRVRVSGRVHDDDPLPDGAERRASRSGGDRTRAAGAARDEPRDPGRRSSASPRRPICADLDAGKLDGIHLLSQMPAYPDVSA